ncbi:MAG TPA: GGDEF domain-containing protein [Bdellovibrionales bacterium]|nr:GGDEF domain-containing protein [Bdellovibrionales bacterium]
MRHADFTSIEIDDVLLKVLAHAQMSTGAGAVHWLSSFGLQRVNLASDSDWQWAFASADVIGKHMWSQPAADTFLLFQMWKQVGALYTEGFQGTYTPHLFTAPHARLSYPLYFEGKLLGVLVIDRPRSRNPVEIVAACKSGLDVAAKYVAFAYQHLEAKNQSYLDELTGLYNQRYLPMALEHEIQRSKREKSQFTLLFLDIDYFKMVNDGRGHWVGSRLLMELGKVLKSQVRSCDYTFRYGGDEFIVVLGNTSMENSKKVAERIRKAVESQSFLVDGHNINLTVSIGLAAYPDHAQSAVGLIKIADEAMYYGKRKSRNIVFVAS